MSKALNVFLRALEECKKKVFLTRTYVEPQSKPAYKLIGIELYVKDKEPKLVLNVSGIYKITNDQEKEEAIDRLVQELIVKVLKHYETVSS